MNNKKEIIIEDILTEYDKDLVILLQQMWTKEGKTPLDSLKVIIKEICKQALELGYENVELLTNGKALNSKRYIIEKYDSFNNEVEIDIDKKTILDTMNQIK